MAKKQKIKVIRRLENESEADCKASDLLQVRLERETAQAELNQRIMLLSTEYDARLAELDIEEEELVASLRDYAERDPQKLLDPARSINLRHAVLQFRTGMPSLKTLSKTTWDTVLENLIKLGYHKKGYVRDLGEEVNKQAIINDRETLTADQLKSIGVKVNQAEHFDVTAKKVEENEI